MNTSEGGHGASFPSLLACHQCDSLFRFVELEPNVVARCHTCGARLYGNPKGGLESALALMITALPLFLIANFYPLLTLSVGGLSSSSTITGASLSLYQNGMWHLAAIVWITSVAAPGFIIVGSIYALLALRFGRALPFMRQFLVVITHLGSWGMMDVFLLGVIVALVKLVGLATVIPGVGLYAFVTVIVVLAAASTRIEPHRVWERFREIS